MGILYLRNENDEFVAIPAISGEDGYSPSIAESNENTENIYKLNIINKDNTFTTPNLKGEAGSSGVYVGEEEPVDEDIQIWINPTGESELTREVFNVKDFGAVGNGITDDTSAIKSAIIAARGQRVYFPTGTYVCNYANINEGMGVDLKGIGEVEIIRTIAPDGNDEAPLFKFNNVPFANIENITFNPCRDNFLVSATSKKDITGAAVPEYTYDEWVDTACLYFYRNGKNITIKNCTFKNCSREGIAFMHGTYSNVVVKNNIFNNTSANFWIPGHVTGFHDFIFENNIADGCRTMCVEFDNKPDAPVYNVKIRNNKFYNTCKCAIQLMTAYNVEISDNEYTHRGELYEHGLKDSDGLLSLFIWLLPSKTAGNELMCNNIQITHNRIKASTGINAQASKDSVVDGGYHFTNISINNNVFEGRTFGSLRFAQNVDVINNKINATGNIFKITQCDNLCLIENEGTAESFFIEETINLTNSEGTSVSVSGASKVIKLIRNIFELTGAVFSLVSFASTTTTRLTLIGNQCNGWNLLSVLDQYKEYVIELCKDNINTGDDCVMNITPGTTTFTSSMSSYIDICSADLSTAAKDDEGFATIRTINTHNPSGRTVYVKFDPAIGIKTDTTATSEHRIVNDRTIPINCGLLIATYTSNGWYIH